MKLHLPLGFRAALLALMVATPLSTAFADEEEISHSDPLHTYIMEPVSDTADGWTSYREISPVYVQNGGSYIHTLGVDRPWVRTAAYSGTMTFSNMDEVTILNAWQTSHNGTQEADGYSPVLRKWVTRSNDIALRVTDSRSFTFSGAHTVLGGSSFINSGSAVFTNVDDITLSNNEGSLSSAGLTFTVTSSSGTVLVAGNQADVLFNSDSSLTFKDCNQVIFRGNNASLLQSGGALSCSNVSSFVLSGNTGSMGDDLFRTLVDDHCSLSFSDVEEIVIQGNTAKCALFANSYLQPHYIMHSESVLFADNRAAEGVIMGDMTFNDIKQLTFSGNIAAATRAYGSVWAADSWGKVCTEPGRHSQDVFLISDCGTVLFENNKALGTLSAVGGAIAVPLTVSANDVIFRGNVAETSMTDTSSGAYGGAFCSSLSGNIKKLVFDSNIAKGYKAYGGAIYTLASQFDSLTDEWRDFYRADAVEYTGNGVVGVAIAGGGAIATQELETVALQGINSLRFVGNYAQAANMADARGGAIYMITSGKSFCIRDNDFVEFRGNYITDGSSYQLQSLYGGGSAYFALAAGEGKRIEIYDGMDVFSNISINGDIYGEDDGFDYSTSTGTVLLSGKHSEEDLAKLKPDYTEEELENSRIFKCGSMHVLNGTLEIRDNAYLVAIGPYPYPTLSNPSFRSIGAKVLLQDSYMGGIYFHMGDMEFYGNNEIEVVKGCLITGGTLTCHISDANKETPLVFFDIKNGAELLLNESTLALTYDSGTLETGTYKLFSFAADSEKQWRLQNITCTGSQAQTVDEQDVYYIWETNAETGNQYKTLVFDYGAGAGARPCTTLTWNAPSGIWREGTLGVWTGSVEDLHFYRQDHAVFAAPASVTVEGTVRPGSVSVNNASGVVEFSAGQKGIITGTGSLTKTGNGELSMQLDNAYTGGTMISGGSVRVGAGAALGLGMVHLSGGSLIVDADGFSNTVVADGSSAISTENHHEMIIGKTIENSGTLKLSGSFDASALKKQEPEGPTLVNTDGLFSTSGFLMQNCYDVEVVKGGTLQAADARFLYDRSYHSMDADGVIRVRDVDSIDYGTYYLSGTDRASAKAINSADFWTTAYVEMSGGTLSIDDSINLRSVTGGTLVFAEGSITGSLELKKGIKVVASYGPASTAFVHGDVILDGGEITLASGGQLFATGSVTLKSKTVFDLTGWSSQQGIMQPLILSSNGVTGSLDNIVVTGTKLSYTLTDMYGYVMISLGASGGNTNNPPPMPSDGIWKPAKGVWSSSMFGGYESAEGDSASFLTAATVTISGVVTPSAVNVSSDKNVTFTADKKVPGSGIAGETSLVKDGRGVLTLNAGNTYTGDTILNDGTIKATADSSFGLGNIILNGGILNLGGKAVTNTIVLRGNAEVKGDAKYAGTVTVEGDAFLRGKLSAKGATLEIGDGASLSLDTKTTIAGNIEVNGGTLRAYTGKGLTLAKNQTLTLTDGYVYGDIYAGKGSTVVWEGGEFEILPILKGGTLDCGGTGTLVLKGAKAAARIGDDDVYLPGPGTIRTDKDFTVTDGTVTLTDIGNYTGKMEVEGGTLKIATGKKETHQEITVGRNAALVNGSTHSGNITIMDEMQKSTKIKLITPEQCVYLENSTGVNGTLYGGSISGVGSVYINMDVDATAAKITAANVYLNTGTYVHKKGFKLAKGQTLHLNGATLELGAVGMVGPKGTLTTTAGSCLVVSAETELWGNLTLGGGALEMMNDLFVGGTLTLSKAMTVTGSGTISYAVLKAAKNVDVKKLFGEETVWDEANRTLSFNGGATARHTASAPSAPAAEEPEALITATPVAPAPLDAAPADPVANPVADAMVQADWGILDAERAFMGAVADRSQHATLLDKGKGAAWVSAFGASVRHGNRGVHHGSDGNIEGAAFGLEHAVSDTGALGLAVGRSKNRIAATGVTHLRQETAHVALYGQKQLKHGFTADAAATYGDTETKLGAATWQQKSAALTARLTHARMLTDATAFRTFGGLTYEATESGSILGAAHTGSVQNFRGELGAGITHTAGKAHLYAEAALTGDMVRHNPTVDLGGFRTHGANPGRLGVRATVGGIYEFSDTWSGTASYGIEAESRSTAHTLNIGVSKSF